MNNLRPIELVLVLAVIVLALGEAYIIFRQPSASLDTTAPTTSNTNGGLQAGDTTTPIAPSNTLLPTGGAVQSAGGGEIVLESGNATMRISISSETRIVVQGARKSDAQFAADMEAFRLESQELAQDPEGNYDALATLIAPSSFVETAISPNDILQGDLISAFIRSSGEAVKIVIIRK